ncbi:hypothetical protein I7I51_00926 [Histoplasma capsulatum]|uniref:Uncharacterized protein n=1 Tax=Ajellomyces capsulatus TaxID=5037 RepID=A0A8A1MBK4_AJECA|nr:hypothetical protein I7I51_00926 [Histoplasma capsulatum]
MAPTISQSFDCKLPRAPEIEFGFKGSYREFKSNVQSTVDIDAIPVFIKEDASVFQTIAERYFPPLSRRYSRPGPNLSGELSHTADLKVVSTCSGPFIPTRERCWRFLLFLRSKIRTLYVEMTLRLLKPPSRT